MAEVRAAVPRRARRTADRRTAAPRERPRPQIAALPARRPRARRRRRAARPAAHRGPARARAGVEIVGTADERRRGGRRDPRAAARPRLPRRADAGQDRASTSCARSAPSAMPATIFVTAFDQFALQAFDLAAVDYLVKPFDDERFEQAFAARAPPHRARGIGELREQLLAVLDSVRRAAAVERARRRPAAGPRVSRAHRRRDARQGPRRPGRRRSTTSPRAARTPSCTSANARISSARRCRRSRSGSIPNSSCASTAR